MKIISAPPPAHAFAFLLWFVTLVFGAVLLSCYLLLFGPEKSSDALAIALMCSGFAGAFSLPVLLILPVSLRWAFTATLVPYRWLRLLAVVGILFGIASFCGYRVLSDANSYNGSSIMWFAAPYLPAALLAAACVYYPWLFRS